MIFSFVLHMFLTLISHACISNSFSIVGQFLRNKSLRNGCSEFLKTPSDLFRLQLSKTDEDGNIENHKTKIAVIGSGAVGCYYGARLWETREYEVKFFMRGEHYEVSRKQGLNVTSVEGDIFIHPNELKSYDNVEKIGKVDWVIIALKSTGLQSIPSLVLPLLTKKTRVVAIMNGLCDDDILDLLENRNSENMDSGTPVLTKCAALYGAMALLCSNRIAPGRIDHSFAGKLTSSLVAASKESDDDNLNKQMMELLWQPTKGFEFVYDDNLTRARWTKNVWNLPFNGIAVAMGGLTVDKIVNDPGLRQLAYDIMDETVSIANEDLARRGYDSSFFLGQFEKDQMMTLSDNMGPYKTSTMLDLLNRRPMEVKYLFRKAIDRANELGVSVPRLETLVVQIEGFQRLYDLF